MSKRKVLERRAGKMFNLIKQLQDELFCYDGRWCMYDTTCDKLLSLIDSIEKEIKT